MKTFKKVLASALAAAMVVTAFPVANAEAATAPKLSATKATIYAGQSKTITVKNLTGAWKGAKVVSASSKKSVATVSRKGNKITVKAVKAGTAKVTVKVTPKKGAAKKLTAKITVKTPSVAFTDSVSEVKIGATATVSATAVPASAKVKYYSADKSIATVGVTSGKVTGVKAGTVKIAAKFYSGKKEVKVYKEITVKDVILKDVKQASTTKLVATIAGNTANVKASDIVITNTYSKANFAVKSVSVSATDKTQVTVETYVAMADGKDYTVTLADVTKTITATDGKIVSAKISPATVVVPTPDPVDGKTINDVSATFMDAKGVEIATVDADKTTLSGFSYVEWKVDATNSGYLDGKTLKLYKVGNTAKITVIAHTGKYNASAVEEGNVTAEVTITGVEPTAITTAGWNVKLGNSDEKATEFKNVKETQVAAKDTKAVAYIQRSTSDGKVANAKDYTFESSDNDVMTLGTVSSSTTVKDTTAVAIKPYKAGSAYIIVKDSKKNVVATLPVTVGAERKATTLTLDKNAFTLSAAAGVDSSIKIKATVKDQYQADMKITKLSYKEASQKDTMYNDVAGDTITLSKPALKKAGEDASYTYIVKCGDLKTTFVVTVKATDGTVSSYALELSADSIDAVIKADATTPAAITATVCGYDKNGVKIVEGVAGASFALTKDGKEAKDVNGVSTGSSIAINDLSGKQMAAGTYLVTATIGSGKDAKTFTKTFEVKNSQPVATASLTKTELDNKSTKLADILKVVYDGKKLSAKDGDFTVVGDKAIAETTNFDKVTLSIKVGKNHVQQEISLGKTVVVK